MKIRYIFIALCVLIMGCTRGCMSCSKTDLANKKILELPLAADVKTLDPQQAGEYYSRMATGLCYATLYDYHYLERPFKIIPYLAKDLPVVFENGTRYLIEIKEGIYFHQDKCFSEKRELTAEDMVYSLKRLADPYVKAPNWVLYNKLGILGLEEMRQSIEQMAIDSDEYKKIKEEGYPPVEGLEAVDKYKLQIKLSRPKNNLVYALAYINAAPVAKEAINYYGERVSEHPVGTGPFIFKNWARGSSLAFVKNPNFTAVKQPTENTEKGKPEDAKLKDKQLPFVDEVCLYTIAEEVTQWLKFMNKEVDVCYLEVDKAMTALDPKTLQLKKNLSDAGVKLYRENKFDVAFLAFNVNRVDNKYFRHALALAFNYDDVINILYPGRAIKAESIIPPGMIGHDPNYKSKYCRFNLEEAKKEMERAKKLWKQQKKSDEDIKKLMNLTITIYPSEVARKLADLAKRYWAEIGVELTSEAYPWSQFQDKIKSKDISLYMMGWIADYPEATTMFDMLYGPNASPGPNNTLYNNQEFNRYYNLADSEIDAKKRVEYYHKMRDIYEEDVPLMPIVHKISNVLYHSYLKNFKHCDLKGNIPMYLDFEITEKLESKKKQIN